MHRNKSVNVHQFAMVPKADIPRSSFRIQKGHKTTFDSGHLVPIYVDEVLPGDTFNLKMTIFCRLATPLFPFMDNLVLDSFFFFIPNRLVWTNWVKFMGEQANPGDSISFVIPQQVSPVGGYARTTLQDLMGLPTVGQVGGAATVTHSALPLRAYNLVYNTWFRDQNLQSSLVVDVDDGPDTITDYLIRRRGKRHDYFTSCLPFVQKGTAISLPISGKATVLTNLTNLVTGVHTGAHWLVGSTGVEPADNLAGFASGMIGASAVAGASVNDVYPSNLYADLSTGTIGTINALRESFQIQKLLERDARGGTRYTEIVRSHFGVMSPDARLQRPEYLGGGSTPINVNPIAVTADAATLNVGDLAAFATGLGHGHGFTQSFTEHGIILGLVNVRADLTYQQGLRKMWSRSTRYDFYFPVFANLGEQAVLNREIYADGSANDALVFGYQERWAEYRYNPSQITGDFRSTGAAPLDTWHLAQDFTALPTLNSTFIEERPPISRVVAVGAASEGQQFLCDAFFDIKAARPLPLYSVPGLIDHF